MFEHPKVNYNSAEEYKDGYTTTDDVFIKNDKTKIRAISFPSWQTCNKVILERNERRVVQRLENLAI